MRLRVPQPGALRARRSQPLPPLAAAPAAGNGTGRASAGFTLLELMVVVAIIAIASAGVSLALRDGSQSRLEREALRLAALLESERAHSRASGVPVRWRPTEGGFNFDTLGGETRRIAWLEPGTTSSSANPVVLGPEPIIGSQSIILRAPGPPERSLALGTDGVRPFAVQGTPLPGGAQ